MVRSTFEPCGVAMPRLGIHNFVQRPIDMETETRSNVNRLREFEPPDKIANCDRSLDGIGIGLAFSGVDVEPEAFRSDCISLFAAIRRSEGSARVVNSMSQGVLIENKGRKVRTGREEPVELFPFMNHQCAFVAFGWQYPFEKLQR